jgi:antitoxin component HigA of HigAB toxin-antitoxin module
VPGRTRTRALLALVLVIAVAVPIVLWTRTPSWQVDYPLFGASFERQPEESYQLALTRVDAALDLRVVRVFYPDQPRPWPAPSGDRDIVVSFKLPPADVLAGRTDEQMRTWFASAPSDHRVFWVYWHEPEDDSEKGEFTPDEYRRAFAHLMRVAESVNNPMLVSTAVLMTWTVNHPHTDREWRDYVPDGIQVLAWDGYSASRSYADVQEMFGPAAKASRQAGAQFAIAEVGAVLADGDDGPGRAQWLREVGAFAVAHDAVFVTYFDFLWNDGKDDYRLDEVSAAAGRKLAQAADDR